MVSSGGVVQQKIQLATVVARFRVSERETNKFDKQFDFGRLLMKFPAVITVRPDGDDFTWLYRCDVNSADLKRMDREAVRPCIGVASELGCEVLVLQVSFLTHLERTAFHSRFY